MIVTPSVASLASRGRGVVNPHRSALVCGWHHSPGPRCPQNDRVPIIPVTILASASINASDAIVVELVEADETPAVVFSQAGQADHLSPAPLSVRRGCCSRVLAAAVVKLRSEERRVGKEWR